MILGPDAPENDGRLWHCKSLPNGGPKRERRRRRRRRRRRSRRHQNRKESIAGKNNRTSEDSLSMRSKMVLKVEWLKPLARLASSSSS
jgi:hypothetical protein